MKENRDDEYVDQPFDGNNQVDESLDTQVAEYDNQSYDQESDQEGIKKSDHKREINDSSKSNKNLKNTNDISDDDIKNALSKLSPSELMVLDKIVNNNNFENNLNDDQELIRESRSNKKRKDKGKKRKNDDDDDDDDDDNSKSDDKETTNDDDDEDSEKSELDNIFNQQECFGANCKGGCVIKRIKIRGKRDSNGTTTSPTESSSPPPPPPQPSSSTTSQLVDQTIEESPKKLKRQAMPNYFKRSSSSSYNPNLDKRIQGKITYLREKGKRDSKNHFDKAYRMKHNTGSYNQYIRRKRESARIAADDPKSPEHIKLLEESFPNSNGVDKSFQSNEPLVRVKRDD